MTILRRTLWCGALIAVALLIVHPAAAQNSAQLDRLVDQLQQQMQVMQQQNREQMQALQQQHQKQIDELREQIQTLQKQVQQAQQQQPRKQVRQAQSQQQPQQQTARPGVQPQPAAAPGPAAAAPSAPAAAPPPSAAVQPPAAAGQGPVVIVGTPPPPGLGPPPSAGVHVLEAGSARFGIESADGRNAIFLTGRLHFDVADYLDYTPASRFAAVQDLNSGVNARRARIGVIARFMRDWDFNLIYDLGGSGDGFPPDPGALVSGLENALLTYSGLKNNGVPLVFDLGYMDVPFSQEESTSSNDIPLVERAAIINVATNIFANDFRSAFGVRSFSDRYWAGAYVTGPTSGTNHTTGGIRSITLSDRPELRVDPTQILSTGPIGTAANPLTNAQVYGGGGIASWRNFQVNGEYYQINVNRQGLATNGLNGGYVEGSWILTGEQRKYSPPAGSYLRPVPEHPFLPFEGSCCGAFELAARYSTIDLNDNFIPRPPPGSNSVGGGQQTVYAAGLNWYPNANMRFLFDFLHGKINKRFSTAAGGGIAGTPPGTPVGGKFDAVVMRTQVAF
jgi:phosphate-selective porin OprO/OprP